MLLASVQEGKGRDAECMICNDIVCELSPGLAPWTTSRPWSRHGLNGTALHSHVGSWCLFTPGITGGILNACQLSRLYSPDAVVYVQVSFSPCLQRLPSHDLAYFNRSQHALIKPFYWRRQHGKAADTWLAALTGPEVPSLLVN